MRLVPPDPEGEANQKTVAEIVAEQESKRLERDDKFQKFSVDLGVDDILDEKFMEMDEALDEIWRNHICVGDEFEFDDITDKKEEIKAALAGTQRGYKKVEVGQNINVKHVIRSKALDDKNFDLYERVPLLSPEEAVKVLQSLQEKDPEWAYDYTQSDGLIEYDDGRGKIQAP